MVAVWPRACSSGLNKWARCCGASPSSSGQARKFPFGQFPYTLVYRIEGPVIHVLALMHQSRMPDYWIGR